jgi:hypothetical protein
VSDADRRSVWADLMRSLPGPVGATKPQLRACVDAADGWVTSAVAGFQAAIPEGLRTDGPTLTLLANTAAIAAGSEVPDVAVGIVTRDQPALLLTAYNAANGWLTSNAVGYLTALGADGLALTTGQAFQTLEAVCRRRAG